MDTVPPVAEPPVAEPPAPDGVRTVDDLTERLGALQRWSGKSFRTVHRELTARRAGRGVPERVSLNTVYRCFQAGRTRLDAELVVEIAAVLAGEQRAAHWRRACEVVAGRSAAAALVDVSGGLPEDRAAFCGRADELARVVELAAAGRPVVVQGMAGVGKTRLAVRAARLLRAPGGPELAVDLRGFHPDQPPVDPAAVLDGFLRRLGADGRRLDLAGRAAEYRRRLAGRHAVVLLDNAAGPEQVAPLLAPGAVVIVTSRHALDGLPGAAPVQLAAFADAEADALLRAAVGAARVDAEPAAAAGIAALLGRLPLALSVAASRIAGAPDWTLADHLHRLAGRRDALTLDDEVELAVGLSYEELAAPVRRTFRLLALHPGADLEPYAAAALTGQDPAAARAHLAGLAAASLLLAGEPGRWAFHDLIRLYASARALDEEPASARQAALDRLAAFYAGTAADAMDRYVPAESGIRPRPPRPAAARPEFADAAAALRWLDAEHGNAVAAGDAVLVSKLLWRYLLSAGQFSTAHALHSRALAGTDPADAADELANLGRTHWHQGEPEQALAHVERAVQLAEAAGDVAAERRALLTAAPVLTSLGRHEEALPLLERALELARRSDDRVAEEGAVGNLGSVLLEMGRHAEAEQRFRRALELAAEAGDRMGEGIALGSLGVVQTRLGRYAEARTNLEQALVRHREQGNRTSEGRTLAALARLAEETGRPDAAAGYVRAHQELAAELGIRIS